MALDTIGVKILEVLQENARVSISELSKQVNLSLQIGNQTAFYFFRTDCYFLHRI